MSSRSSPVTSQGPRHQKHVYKEVFFAGFPPVASKTNNELLQSFDGEFVRAFFNHYGLIEHFVYDDLRGVGSVTFASGDDAERFYLAMHLSVLECPVVLPESSTDSPSVPTQTVSVMLYLEFAQACPFANPQVLLKEELLSGEMSRYALQGSAPPEGLTRTTAESVVAAWQFVEKRRTDRDTGPAVQVVEDVAETTERGDAAAHPTNCETGTGADRGRLDGAGHTDGENEIETMTMTLFGPVFPGLPVHPPQLQVQVWMLLRPSRFSTKNPPEAPMTVTVLDLWYEFYTQYILHKTQPAPNRIADPQLAFAEQPSLLQQIRNMTAHPDNSDHARRLQRLAEDDVFHGALNYVWMLQKYKYDPVWASFMRDVYTDKVSSRVQLHMSEWSAVLHAHQERKTAAAVAQTMQRRNGRRRGAGGSRTAAVTSSAEVDSLSPKERMAIAFAAQRHDLLKMREANKSQEEASAKVWAAMGVFEATENLLENVEYLRLVRLGRVDKKTGHVMSLEEKLERKTKTGDDVVDEDAYPLTGTHRQKQEFLYTEIIRMLDGYVQTGAATELLYLCEAPTAFRSSSGHVGYDELHDPGVPRRQYWLAVLNALWVPLILISLLIWGVNHFVGPMELVPKRNVTAMKGAGRRVPHQRAPPPPGNDYQDFQATLKKAQEMAKKRGGHFSMKLNVLNDP